MFPNQTGDLASFSVPPLTPVVAFTGHYGIMCFLKTGSADSVANVDAILLDTHMVRKINRIMRAHAQRMSPNFCPCSNTDVHTVASLLKLYLRELPEPVVPYAKYEDFLSCATLLSKEEEAVSRYRFCATTWLGLWAGLFVFSLKAFFPHPRIVLFCAVCWHHTGSSRTAALPSLTLSD